MRVLPTVCLLFTLFCAMPITAAPLAKQKAPTELTLSHQLDEARAEHLAQLVERFNAQQKDVQLKLVRRLADAAPTDMNLLTRGELARFLVQRVKFKPLYELMREAKEPFDANKLPLALRTESSDAQGRLFALPLAMTTPLLYINKTLFRQAGLDPEQPPKTWWDVQQAALKLLDAGSACPFTSAWPALLQIDNMSVWNDAEVSDAKGNFIFNGLAQIKHVALLSSWRKSKLFAYFGRRDEADHRFAAGECGMLTSTSSLYAALRVDHKLEIGIAPLPYYDDLRGAPRHTLADGAALWVAGGKRAAEYKGVARFVSFLLNVETQHELTQVSGFLPMTLVARNSLPQADRAESDMAYAQLPSKGVIRVLRVSQIEPVRIIVEEEMEAVWANKKTAKEALDSAVLRANAALPVVLKTRYPL